MATLHMKGYYPPFRDNEKESQRLRKMLRSLPRQEDRYMPTNITDIFQTVTRKAGWKLSGHNTYSFLDSLKSLTLVQNRKKVAFLICLTLAMVYQFLMDVWF